MSNELNKFLADLQARDKAIAEKERTTRRQEAKARRLHNDSRYGYPKAPNPTTIKGWVLKLYNWFLRRYGWKKGEVHDYWQGHAFTFLGLERQERCPHLKGMVGYSASSTDYNVSKHTFIDGSTRITCNTCRWEVWNKPEFSLKWKAGEKMVTLSTNRASSGERVPKPDPTGPPTGQGIRQFMATDTKSPIVGLNVTDEDYKIAKAREAAAKKEESK
jgi:hypothetical protein